MAKKTVKSKVVKKKPLKTVKSREVKKKPPKKESQRDKLEMELKGYIKKIDEEGLLFLLKQAHVIIHNSEVDKINREIEVFEEKKVNTRKKTGIKKASGTTGKKSAGVEIEEISNGKSFFIALKNARKIFDLNEMRSLVKICHSAGDEITAGTRLYKWLRVNRMDVLADCGLAGNGDPYLALLYQTIIKTYAVKG